MSHTEAQLISSITGGLLVAMLVTALLRSYFLPVTTEVKGLPVSTFHKKDIIFVVFVLAFYVLVPLSSFMHVDTPPREIEIRNLSNSFIFQIAIALPVFWRLWDMRLAPISGWYKAEIIPSLIYGVLAIAVTYLCVLILQSTGFDKFIIEKTGAPEFQHSVNALKEGPLHIKIALAIGSVFIAPFAEEICFRGYIYPVLKRYTGAIFAAISTSLLFGIIHSSLVQAIPLAVFGLMLVLTYEKAKSIWIPIATHMAFNAITVIYIFSPHP